MQINEITLAAIMLYLLTQSPVYTRRCKIVINNSAQMRKTRMLSSCYKFMSDV